VDSTLPCLVLIPGTLCDARIFAHQRRALRGTARVEMLEYDGVRDIPRWVSGALKRLPQQFSVAGFSLGGLCALALLRAAPERVDRVALIASNAEAAGARAGRRSAWLARLWRARGPDAVVRQVKPDYFHHGAVRRRYAALVRDMALSTDGHAALAQFRWAGTRPSGLDLLQRSEQPLLIVSGARDELCPRTLQQRILGARPDAQWIELARCGHFVPLEAPARLTASLSTWLQLPRKINPGDTP
jgi:pimeloyl-ACP methyl ester carboxylesterase